MTENDLFKWLTQDDRILEADNVPRFMGIRDCICYMQNPEQLPNQNVVCCKIHSDLVGEWVWVGLFYSKCLLEDKVCFEPIKRWIFQAFEFAEEKRLNEKAKQLGRKN